MSSDIKKLWSLFQNIDASENAGTESLNRTLNSSVLIVDGLNTFLRSWAVSPFSNENGEHFGGVSSFLKSIGYAVKLFNPTRCVIVFDGNGGSQKRRKIYPEYKHKRKTSFRVNRTYKDLLTPEEEQDRMKGELMRSIQYLDCLPVNSMAIDHIEADDTIAYLAVDYFKNSDVVIMSADKDFLQLASNKIKIWSPTKKKVYGCAEILSEYGISCQNFINYRIMDGDVSDNIDGIKGAGLKTIKKLFPCFEESKQYSVSEIVNYCENHKGKYKLYDTILENKSILERNYQLMQLFDTQIQSFSQLRINEIMDRPLNKLNKFQFSKLITEDHAWNGIPNYGVWLSEVWGKLNTYVV